MAPDFISQVTGSVSAPANVSPVTTPVAPEKVVQQLEKDRPAVKTDTKTGAPTEEAISNQKRDLKEAVTQINNYVQNLTRDLAFSIDDVSGDTVITVTDPETEEVIRQIPSEDLLKIARFYAEKVAEESKERPKGILFEKQV